MAEEELERATAPVEYTRYSGGRTEVLVAEGG